ncbi:MAG: hypothetical protein GF317_23960 [Candidatus Lokiarchaeota archaeon]|nr:hypothetical protein [Candidatus Lokiarchaeota archaeon]MBD3202429.1 hypothetical protein [Candidatus Lokiarchaeota archaeon]
MDETKRNFIVGIIVSACISSLISLTSIWQLFIIAGIVGGLINKTVKYGAFSGALGVFIQWGLYIIDGLLFKSVYGVLDIFGSFIIGVGYGWLILILIIFLGFIIGGIGGTIGSSGRIITEYYSEKRKNPESSTKITSKISNS